jgi:ribosomal protection tetracycline resistance protein
MNFLNKKIKNIGIFAHVDAGKTTLTEQLLYHTGAISHLGRVDHGDTLTDSLDLEKERGITIMSASTSYTYKDQKVNIIDTPGHTDFVAEVERSMLALDGAVLVISAKEGVQSHTKLLFNALNRMNIPTLIFINKIDRMGVVIEHVINGIQKLLSTNIITMQSVSDSGSREATLKATGLKADDKTIELLSEVDDTLMMDYLEGGMIEIERLRTLLKTAVNERLAYPVFFGSALNNIGVEEILDAINDFLPQFTPLESEMPGGIVFGTGRSHKKKGRFSVLKLTSGYLKKFDNIGEDKVTNISIWENGRVKTTDHLNAGDIGLVMGLHHLNIGDVFGCTQNKNMLSLGKPTLRSKISSKQPIQRKALLEALSLMQEADPYLSYELSDFNDDIYINLFGYVQMEIVKEMLKRDYGVEVEMADPMTIYMETPLEESSASKMMFEDGLRFSAGVALKIEPLERGSGVQYHSEVGTGDLKPTFQKGVEDGVFAFIDQGLKGWELTDMKITFTDFQFNSVDSTPKEYRDLAPLVLFEALQKSGTRLLWPVSDYTLNIPVTLMGKAISDLQQMQATMSEPMIEGETCVIKGQVPNENLNHYEMKVHEYTSGMGFFESKFSGYEDAPKDVYYEREKFKIDPANRGKYLLSKLNTF